MDLDRQRPIDTRSETRVKAEPSAYTTPYLHFLFTPPFTAAPFMASHKGQKWLRTFFRAKQLFCLVENYFFKSVIFPASWILTASQELFPQAKNTQHAMSSFATKMITWCIAHKMAASNGASSPSRHIIPQIVGCIDEPLQALEAEQSSLKISLTYIKVHENIFFHCSNCTDKIPAGVS